MHGRQWCLRKTNYDRSALEYAILSGAPMKVARLLQAVTITQTKKQVHEMSTMLVRGASQDSHDHGNEQQHQTTVSEPSEREHDPTKFDAAASTTTSMPAREEHLPSSRRGAIFLPYYSSYMKTLRSKTKLILIVLLTID